MENELKAVNTSAYPIPPASGKSSLESVQYADAYGGVLIDDDERVLLREPTGHHGQYVWTFPKGRRDAGETPEQTALREVREEVGYEARIIGSLPNLYGGTTTTTGFFVMKPLGEQGAYDSRETARTQWVTFEEALSLICRTRTPIGRQRDITVLEEARKVYGRLRLAR